MSQFQVSLKICFIFSICNLFSTSIYHSLVVIDKYKKGLSLSITHLKPPYLLTVLGTVQNKGVYVPIKPHWHRGGDVHSSSSVKKSWCNKDQEHLFQNSKMLILEHSKNKTKVKSVQLGNTYIADMDKCPQDKCCLDKCRGDSCNLLYLFPGPFV